MTTLLDTTRLYSLKEFEDLDLPSDGNKYELIDGVQKLGCIGWYANGKPDHKLRKFE